MADGETIDNLAVAQVGEGENAKYYTSLADAFDQTSPVEVKLIGDCTVDNAITIGENKDIMLDLNDYTVDCAAKHQY